MKKIIFLFFLLVGCADDSFVQYDVILEGGRTVSFYKKDLIFDNETPKPNVIGFKTLHGDSLVKTQGYRINK